MVVTSNSKFGKISADVKWPFISQLRNYILYYRMHPIIPSALINPSHLLSSENISTKIWNLSIFCLLECGIPHESVWNNMANSTSGKVGDHTNQPGSYVIVLLLK